MLDQKEYVEFLVGRNGDFDQCVASSIRRAKREYRDCNSAFVLVLPYATADYTNNEKYYEDYYEMISTSRNKEMAKAVASYLVSNKDVFYIVGLAHFIGEGNVIELLSDMGYTVTRVQYK